MAASRFGGSSPKCLLLGAQQQARIGWRTQQNPTGLWLLGQPDDQGPHRVVVTNGFQRGNQAVNASPTLTIYIGADGDGMVATAGAVLSG